MKLPTKEEVKRGAQLLVLLYMLIEGFFCTYSLIWFRVGLPQEWWALLITTVLGMLSTFGLITWIARN